MFFLLAALDDLLMLRASIHPFPTNEQAVGPGCIPLTVHRRACSILSSLRCHAQVPINMAIVDTTTASDSIVGGVGLTVAASPLLRTAHRGTVVFWTGMPYAGKGVVRLPETRLTTGRMCVCVHGGEGVSICIKCRSTQPSLAEITNANINTWDLY